ncbi:Peptidylprolyl isomerase [Plesiocystis pacifica SIR-1]|uniref:Peptidyl-prolyl cis-trans isomerase n=1 Tax=Plesiocystis pacifica SIR-1 TaxID=391625 RepID=A6G614_9BACT|nr:FKBP-type peptidyl-prolyl cis-trans isomerase [Plesiocystis pacifica]EDM78616.1 Peptidylprolyl isomerase [Plesiocystis pacifica SIR-1]
MPTNHSLTRGRLALLASFLACACSAQAAQELAASPEDCLLENESESETDPEPEAAEPEPEAPSAAEERACIDEQLLAGESFEAGEPEDYDWRASGLGIFVRAEGEGEPVADGDLVTFAYTGYLLDGCAFDSTLLREPIAMPLGGMIPGMREGLIGMRVGGQRRLYIPPELAYGETGAGAVIGPNEVLVFEVELLEKGS